MDVTYAIVKVYITECNEVIKGHSYVVIIWLMPAIKVTALLKNQCSEMTGMQAKESIMDVRGR